MDAEAYARWVLEPPRPAELVRPRQSYFVCATPRSGSWFLCGLLASTGVAGRPHEWFWRDTRASLERRWSVRSADEYVKLVLAAGMTANGVFGAKVMFGSLPALTPFPRPRFVWMRRRDRVAQAASFAKAVQTGTGTTGTRRRTLRRATASTLSTRCCARSRPSNAAGRSGSHASGSSRSRSSTKSSRRIPRARRGGCSTY